MSLLRSLDSPQHARLRFSDTVVIANGKVPVYVHNINDEWMAHCSELGTQKVIDTDIRSGELSPVPFSLGFCQVANEAFYLARKPSRRSKQGLDVRDMWIYHTLGNPLDILSNSSFRALARTIKGEFATFEAAIKSVTGKKSKSLAFHKDWALVNLNGTSEILVNYKFFGPCGRLEENGIRLDNKYVYLKETLEEDVGNVCA